MKSNLVLCFVAAFGFVVANAHAQEAVETAAPAPAGEKDPAPDPNQEPVQEPVSKPTIRKGNKGLYVTLAQTMLLNRGYLLPKYGADGDFGAETEAAVKLFQKDWGLTPDGVIGPKTWAMLDSTPAKPKTYTVTIFGLDTEQANELLMKYSTATKVEEA